MTTASPSRIRNIAVLAHSGAGKTTLIESLLFASGAISSKGSVERGKAVMLTEPEEISHHMAIMLHVGHMHWKDTAIYFVDTPGAFNFLENTRGALPGVDGALFLFTGTEAVKPESIHLWRMIEQAGIPVIGFVNQMDEPTADLGTVVTLIEQTIGKHVQPVTFPIRRDKEILGVVDLIRQKVSTTVAGRAEESPLPESMKNELERARVHLIERIVESNDDLMESYLGGTELSAEELLRGLKNAVAKREFVPLLCGSGKGDIGVHLLLDYLTACLPSPIERDELRPVSGHRLGHAQEELTRKCATDQPFSARVMKTTIDPFFGKLSIVRVFSGSVKCNDQILNSSRDIKEKVGHTYLLQGKELAQVASLCAGEVGAIAKLDETHTGDTISSVDDPIVYTAVEFASPPISYAVEADNKKNDEKVSAALMKLADEDPSLHFYRDEQTHQMILGGMGQTHIEVTLERLERKFGAHAILKAPKVPYRETIRKTVKVQGKLKKQTGGHGQFANTWLEVGPLPRGAGFEFEDRIVGGIIPKQYIPSVKKGVQDAMQRGFLGGFPVTDVHVALYDGSFHDVDSSDYAFQAAGSLGFKSALEEAESALLEPIMSMRIVVPEECAGSVIKDITSRRGRILGLDSKPEGHEICAEAPMAELLEYGQRLGAMTSGRGTYTMHVDAYAEVPGHIVVKVLADLKKDTDRAA